MNRYGLIGYPLSHSFSEAFFRDKFQKEGITDAEYRNYPIETVSELPDLIASSSLKGLNVTIPYKEQVLSYLNAMDTVVNVVQACNCIAINGTELKGYNTDVIGFRKSLQQHLNPHHKRSFILGEGGAAKAVAYVLRSLDITFSHVVRRKTSPLQLHFSELTESMIADTPLLINTTPVGTSPHVDESPIPDFDSIGEKHYLYDLIYNPSKTLFLARGEARGATIKNGLEMLIIQAEESWKIWNSESPNL